MPKIKRPPALTRTTPRSYPAVANRGKLAGMDWHPTPKDYARRQAHLAHFGMTSVCAHGHNEAARVRRASRAQHADTATHDLSADALPAVRGSEGRVSPGTTRHASLAALGAFGHIRRHGPRTTADSEKPNILFMLVDNLEDGPQIVTATPTIRHGRRGHQAEHCYAYERLHG